MPDQGPKFRDSWGAPDNPKYGIRRSMRPSRCRAQRPHLKPQWPGHGSSRDGARKPKLMVYATGGAISGDGCKFMEEIAHPTLRGVVIIDGGGTRLSRGCAQS